MPIGVTPSPCRLSVFVSRWSTVAVILRRGPSAWAQLSLWDRGTDTFTHGQWFHGRVYERRCDLSPDGKLFVYFAAKHGRVRDDDAIGEAWTAISKPPYFTALALWPNLGSWYGGGVFKTDKLVELDASCGLEPHPKFRPAPGFKVAPMAAATAPWEQRLLRDHWLLVERGFDPRTHRRVGAREVWEKPHPDGDIKLCREIEDVDLQRYGGPYNETFWFEADGDLMPLTGVSWAEWDDGEHIVLVRDGRLLRAAIGPSGLQEERELFDFNPLSPEEMAPPDSARKW
jgi:hypothetical protein